MADGTMESRGSDSESIRRGIERTRADMDETVEELGDRLSPGRLLDELWHHLRSGRGDGHMSSVVREHPVPLALMGLGLGWLAVEQATGRSASHDGQAGPATWAPADGRKGPYGPDAINHADPDWEHAGADTKLKGMAADAGSSVKRKASGAADRAGEKAAELAGTAKEKASDAAGRVKEKAMEELSGARELQERVSEKASHLAGDVREGAAAAGRTTKRGLRHAMEDNPLAMGALAFGLGLASGVSVPSSPVEDKVMGRAADSVKDEAGRVAKDTGRKVKHVMEDAAEAAADELDDQRELGRVQEAARETREAARDGANETRDAAGHLADEVKEAAKAVGHSAKDAADRSAREEHLTADGMKAEVKRAGQRARSETRKKKPRAAAD